MSTFMPMPLTGPAVIVLEKSPDGAFLEIADGSLEGLAEAMLVPFFCRLEGRKEN